MAEYKLTYFNAKGRAEISRLVLVVAGIPFQDHRVDYSEYASSVRDRTPFGNLPTLEIRDGYNARVLAQSAAIARYLANKFGFAGKTELDKAEIDMYMEQMKDLQDEYIRILFEKDQVKKAEQLSKFENETMPKNFQIFERKLANNSSGFLVGDFISLADFFLFILLDGLKEKKDFVLNRFPHIKKLNERIQNNGRVAEWLRIRPVTDN